MLFVHQCACHGKNKTIHSSPQIDHCKNIVDDHSIKVSSGQHITTLDKFKIPISIRGALPYIKLCPCTDKEWENLPHVILDSDKYWDPTSLDCEGQLGNEKWFDAQSSFPYRPD